MMDMELASTRIMKFMTLGSKGCHKAHLVKMHYILKIIFTPKQARCHNRVLTLSNKINMSSVLLLYRQRQWAVNL